MQQALALTSSLIHIRVARLQFSNAYGSTVTPLPVDRNMTPQTTSLETRVRQMTGLWRE
jgi:hypothetical protein